ncbi:MAG: FadR family transcriptional regulator, partial [Tetrasphaera sp.]|nr:FadR family transcriptional regulator [Tetrasphaera sp.]
MSDKFGHDSLVMRLAERLRADDVKAGAVLPSESALMAELGVGRQQLREALGVLEAFGAVNSRQGARRRWVGADLGSLVASSAELTGEPRTTVAELLVVRQALETSLLAKVMPLHTAASRAEIRELAHEMEERAAQGRSFAELDQQFHLSLFAPLRNSTLEGILGAFWT